MNINFRKAKKEDILRCIEIRGQTNDNQFTANDLASIGVAGKSWSPLIENNDIIGFVAIAIKQNILIGFCFGNSDSGEILVLAVHSGYEGHGIGKELLSLSSESLFSFGHKELWLAASATPVVRAHGFYRHVGWYPTETFNDDGDEILKLSR